MVKVRVQVIERLKKSKNAPSFGNRYYEKRVMENDRVGHLIDLFQATDMDRDNLFYSIIGNIPPRNCPGFLRDFITFSHFMGKSSDTFRTNVPYIGILEKK